MANSINKVTLVGNLGRDPEIRHTNAGQKIANLSVATSDSWKDKNGERQERTEWHRVVVFNANLASFAEQYLKKGSKIYLEGSLQTRKYTDATGSDRYSTEIVLNPYRGDLILLDRGSSADDSTTDTAAPMDNGSANGWDTTGGQAGGFDDEIPF